MLEPPVEERLARLNAAKAHLIEMNGAPESTWSRECETRFNEFRTTVMHLRREKAAIDGVEQKELVWDFICTFSKRSQFHSDRCTEVLKILMMSEAWMKSFGHHSIDELPPAVQREFRQRQKTSPPEEKGKPRPGVEPTTSPGSAPMRPQNVAVIVQRCSQARVLLDEKKQTWGEMGSGIMVSVSFTKGAKDDALMDAATFLLSAKISGQDAWKPGRGGERGHATGSDVDSVVNICSRGGEQGILVLAQSTISSELAKDNVGLSYEGACPRREAEQLYRKFVEALHNVGKDLIKNGRAPQILDTPFGGRQYMEVTQSNPMMHAFHF